MGDVAWIVGSLKERHAALELFDHDGEAEPRDELGIGFLRDALADAFFPGITTLQTRAKYFLLVPAMYRVIENRRRRTASAAAQITQLERELLIGLKASSDVAGVIGRRRWVVPQTPSSAIYWTGLRTWRIRSFSDPRPRYHRWLDGGGRRGRLGLSEEDADEPSHWHEFIDSRDVLSSPSMGLRTDEADFLATRILAIKDRPTRSLLKDLVSDRTVPDADFLWEIPAVADGIAALSAEARDAQRLSAALHGAMLTYNYRCAQLREREIWIDDWAERSKEWWSDHPSATWREWDLDTFWKRILRLPGGTQAVSATRTFVDSWVNELSRQGAATPAERESAQRVVERRERQVKRNRARLLGGPALRTWDGGVGVGADRMRFRWSQAGRILRDLDSPIQA